MWPAAPIDDRTAVDPNGVNVPQSMLQSMMLFNNNGSPYTNYQIPLADGQYR